MFRDVRETSLSVAGFRAAFRAVCRVGGERGWNTSWLWRLRGWLDRQAGGPGLRRGRRHPESLRYGDALDFWRVVGIERDRSLSLRAEMKLPGQALLDFRVEPDGRSAMHATSDRSLRASRPGRIAVLVRRLPFHAVVFRTMLAGIRRDARDAAGVQQRIRSH